MPLVNVSFTDIQAIDSVGVPPLPIPNREVKPNSADGTAKICGRVGHRRFFRKSSNILWDSFFYLRVLRTSAAQLKIHSRLFTYVGAHRCVRPTNAREFHSGRHIGLPLHCGCYLYSLRNLRINFSTRGTVFCFCLSNSPSFLIKGSSPQGVRRLCFLHCLQWRSILVFHTYFIHKHTKITIFTFFEL